MVSSIFRLSEIFLNFYFNFIIFIFLYFIFLFQYITAGARSATWVRDQGLTGIFQMASPGCRRWQHKGRTSTNPALNRYGRSRSALYRADMAMGTSAQWSFHALRAHPGLGSAHLSCRATWMLLDRAPSWRQRGRPQPVNQAQDLGEHGPWNGYLRHLERDIATMR